MQDVATLPSPQEVVVRTLTNWVAEEAHGHLFGEEARQHKLLKSTGRRSRPSGGTSDQSQNCKSVFVRRPLAVKYNVKAYVPDGRGGMTREVQQVPMEVEVPAGSELCLVRQPKAAGPREVVATLFTPTQQFKLYGSGFCVVRDLR